MLGDGLLWCVLGHVTGCSVLRMLCMFRCWWVCGLMWTTMLGMLRVMLSWLSWLCMFSWVLMFSWLLMLSWWCMMLTCE